ncbi:MAG: ASCH domain-containing protein [Planctomycetes bacterium]|nr:ASCH domain-containing protein [Planctomycetota bacterium]
MDNEAILFSIHPKYAKKIFEGTKTVELRRVLPKRISEGMLALLYVSSPVKSLFGAFKVDKIIVKTVERLWEIVKDVAGITVDEFEAYYDGANIGVGIFFSDVWQLPQPIKLKDLRKDMVGFYPPQGFRYASKQELSVLKLA